MRFGTFFLSQAPPELTPARALEWELGQIELAEELGFDSVWLAEHHFTNYCVINDPLTYAAYVAARTSRIRIGLAVSILPLHHPIEIAERAALVDILSGGRLNVGLGRGYSGHEFANYGVSLEDRSGRFREGLDIITRLWTEECVQHEGQYWTIREACLYPKPLQQPHPPVYIASSGSPETIAVAAERGLPMIQGVDFLTPDTIRSRYEQYRRAATRASKAKPAIETALAASAVTQKVFVAATRDEALSVPAPYVMWRHRKIGELTPSGPPASVVARTRRQLRPVRRMVTGSAARDWEEITWQDLCEFDIYGTPDECIAKIQRMAEAGARTLICWFAYGGMPDHHVRRAMELFAKEVMPAFREMPAEANATGALAG